MQAFLTLCLGIFALGVPLGLQDHRAGARTAIATTEWDKVFTAPVDDEQITYTAYTETRMTAEAAQRLGVEFNCALKCEWEDTKCVAVAGATKAINDVKCVKAEWCIHDTAAKCKNKHADVAIYTIWDETIKTVTIAADTILWHYSKTKFDALKENVNLYVSPDVCQSALYVFIDKETLAVDANVYLYKLKVKSPLKVALIEKNAYPIRLEAGHDTAAELQGLQAENSKNAKTAAGIKGFCKWAKEHGVVGWRQPRDQNEVFLCKDMTTVSNAKVEVVKAYVMTVGATAVTFVDGTATAVCCTGNNGTATMTFTEQYPTIPLKVGDKQVVGETWTFKGSECTASGGAVTDDFTCSATKA